MSRQFDGVDDVIVFAAGSIAPVDGGPFTLAMLYNATAVKAGGLIWTRNAGGTQVWQANPFSDGNIYLTIGGSFRSTTYTAADGWTLLVFTKANGVATPRVHKYHYDAPGWSHADMSGTLPDSTDNPITEWQVGKFNNVSDFFEGQIGAMAVWDVALSDGNVETLNPNLGAWMDLNPVMCCPFNQASTATPVTDITGNGADQTAITGTTVSASEPTGWSYSTGVDGTGAADLGALTGTATGTVVTTGTGSTNLGALTATAVSRQGTDPLVSPLMDMLKECLCDAFSDHPSPPLHCCFRVGTEVAHDVALYGDLCCDGLAYVALGDIYPSSSSFPEQDIIRQANTVCAPPAWAVHFKLGVIRCSPVGTLQDMPTCAEWEAAAQINVMDARALRIAACCIRNQIVVAEGQMLGMSVVLERQVQGNPLGGCVERSFSIAIQIPNCDC